MHKGIDCFRAFPEMRAVSRRDFMLGAAGVGGGALVLGSGFRPAAPMSNWPVSGDSVDLAVGQTMNAPVTRADVQRFGRISNLMTPDQLRLATEGLPTVEKLPDELAKSLTPEETETALRMIAWISRWKARHAEPKVRTIMPPQVELAPYPLCRPLPSPSISSVLRTAPAPSITSQAESRSRVTGSPIDQTKLCQLVEGRLGTLQQQAEQAVAAATSAFNHARGEHQAAVKDYGQGSHQEAWSHIMEAMNEVKRIGGYTDRLTSVCSESDATVRAVGETFPCHNEMKVRLNRIYDACKTAFSLGTADFPGTDLGQLHFALIRLGQQIDEGLNTDDPSVQCVDLSYTGDFWNWWWKQIRGGWGGDTNLPGWYPVDWFNVVQATIGSIESITMEPDGDIHINLSGPSVTGLINGNNPGGQLICEIPLCDRWWFNNLNERCVGTLIYVVGKWMVDVWNGWYELHPIYYLAPLGPVIVG